MFVPTASTGSNGGFWARSGFDTPGVLFRPVLYPAIYPWFVLAASLDILTTWIILNLGGTEVNPIAAKAIAGAGVAGMAALKFSMVVVVLLVCEYVGRARAGTGRRLAWCSVALNCAPVGAAVVQIVLYALQSVPPVGA